MKKTVLVVLGALAFSTVASANWYAGVDLGASRVKFSGYSELNETKLTPSVSVGYDFGDWRLAADYTYYGSFDGQSAGKYIESKIYGLGFSAFYDFRVNSDIKPYVGARVAQNSYKVESRNTNTFSDDTHYKLGMGVVAGAQYQFAPNWSLNGAVEYNRLGKFEDTKVNQYGAKVGIRFDF